MAEFAYGLDPIDPFDGSRDSDSDGVSIGGGIGFGFDRYWSNLEEYRFTAPPNTGTMVQIPEFPTQMEIV